MPKITFIGAGSFGFTRNLVRDVLTFHSLDGSTICLMDINPERLEFSRRAVQRIVDEGGYPPRSKRRMDRVEALTGADYVLVTILVGATDVWRHDIEIPKKYGVDINVGDTRGLSGIFRAPAHDPGDAEHRPGHGTLLPRRHHAQLHQPDGHALPRHAARNQHPGDGPVPQRAGHGRDAGRLDRRPDEEITFTCAGINHMAWYLDYQVEWGGCLSA